VLPCLHPPSACGNPSIVRRVKYSSMSYRPIILCRTKWLGNSYKRFKLVAYHFLRGTDHTEYGLRDWYSTTISRCKEGAARVSDIRPKTHSLNYSSLLINSAISLVPIGAKSDAIMWHASIESVSHDTRLM